MLRKGGESERQIRGRGFSLDTCNSLSRVDLLFTLGISELGEDGDLKSERSGNVSAETLEFPSLVDDR